MAEGFLQEDLNDPDLVWLLKSFSETRRGYILINEIDLPIVLLKFDRAMIEHQASGHDGKK